MKTSVFFLAAFALATASLSAQTPAAPANPNVPADPAVATPADYVLITVILKQDQSKNLDEIAKEMDASGFWAKMPPEGIKVESWYVVMGLGQVLTVRVPPARLREFNLTIEHTAWKSFRTEIYPTYDLRAVAEANRQKAAARK